MAKGGKRGTEAGLYALPLHHGQEKASGPKAPKKPKEVDMTAGRTLLRDLHKLMAKQNFQSVEEIEAFMEKYTKEHIPEFLPEGPEEEAEALVELAASKPRKEAVKMARQALEIDPDCIPAFLVLAAHEDLLPVSAALFKRGVDLGYERFGDEYMEQNRGHFWGLTETRPFMRCLYGFADTLFDMGDFHQALSAWLEMLELNPSDNTGAREPAMLVLAALRDTELFLKLDAQFPDDDMCGTLYNRALMAFVDGDRAKATRLLKAAIKRNPHVPGLLTAEDEPDRYHGAYTPGSEEEALQFCKFAWVMWQVVPGALDWLGELQQPKLFKV